MNSLQSMTEADVQRGESYLSVMTQNLAILTQALN